MCAALQPQKQQATSTLAVSSSPLPLQVYLLDGDVAGAAAAADVSAAVVAGVSAVLPPQALHP